MSAILAAGGAERGSPAARSRRRR